MANALYGPGREGFALAEIDWDTAVIKAALVRLTAGGAPVFTTAHKFVSDLTATHTLASTSGALASKTGTLGTVDAADLTPAFTAVAANVNNHVVVLFQASAVGGGADVAAAAQRLIAWIDTGTNIPIVPNGGDVNIAWDNGANRIFTL